jgi:large subunit ribosomal protein L17
MGRRHHSIISKLNRNTQQRQSLFKIQLRQLIELGSITTTVTKAKVIKRLFDRLASKAVDGTLHDRRGIAADLSSPKTANRLFDLIVPAMGGRKSGFTTIQKNGIRKGDSTSTASLSLVVPLPPTPVKEKKVAPKKDVKKAAPKVKKTK